MKILITGGNGYIARSIYSSLFNKYDITTINRQDFNLTDWQATNQFFKGKFFDVVIHTATTGGSRLKKDEDSVLKDNLLMYRNLLANQDKYTKFISFGSGAELGNPVTPYGISKQVIAESMQSKVNFLNLRIFAVFDENEIDSRFIKSNINRYANQENIIIHEDKVMDFFYMADLISLIDYFLTKEEWTYNYIDCVYREKLKLTDIANIINQLSDYKVPVELQNPTGGEAYTGMWRGLPTEIVGLHQGIQNVYNILK